MDSDACEGIFAFLFLFIGSIVGLVCGGIVISDINETKEFNKLICDASDSNNDIESSIGAYHSTLSNVWVVTRNGSDNIRQYTTELFYPPIRHYLLDRKSESDNSNWASSLQTDGTFSCFIGEEDGVSTKLDPSGWIALMFFSALFLAIVIGITLYYTCKENCYKKKPVDIASWRSNNNRIVR